MRPALALAPLIAALAAPAFATARLDVAIRPQSATVGDPLEVTLELHLDGEDAASRATFPDWSHGWGALQPIAEDAATAPPTERGETPDGVVLRQKVSLAAYQVGKLDLPALAVGLEGGSVPSVESAPASIEIVSVIPDDEKAPEPKPPAPPRPLELPRAFAWTAAGLAALAALLGAALVARRRRLVAAATPPPPPLDELEAELGALSGVEPLAGHARLSLALRRFLGRSFPLPALASSTSEIARRLDGRGLDPGLVRRAVRLLRDTDGVKFAGHEADAASLSSRRAEALEIARAVDLHLHPPAPVAAPESDAA